MFAEILIAHGYAQQKPSLSYAVPENMNLKPGDGVVVPFGKRSYPGLVTALTSSIPDFKTREIESILDPQPLLRPWQLDLMKWLSEYYFCSLFESAKLFLPKGVWRLPKTRASKEPKPFKSASLDQHQLTPDQAKIVQAILSDENPISLLQGITGSGKTEVYKHLIQANLAAGKQCLLMVPEISLTPQFKRYFEQGIPESVVIHSRITEAKRAEAWKRIHSGEIKLVMGSRSSLFSPFKNLGLIVMDEEHEWTYKQEQSPRYHAREVALKCAELTGAKVVFGSATPSLETRYQAGLGNYRHHKMDERISGTALPSVQVVDMRIELKKKNFSMFSEDLEAALKENLEKGEQSLLFLNRRGSASSTLCRDCGLVLSCPACEVKLTFHAKNFGQQTLVCHHCGRFQAPPTVCPGCQSTRIRQLGLGTERVEQELQALFPSARILRADRDTMNKSESFAELHEKMNDADQIDILLGTQMIGKGLDLPRLSLVGVLLADMGLHLPDFRSAERNFQLLTQVAGRAGRRDTQGQVLIQTYTPENASVHFAKTHDYESFYAQEIEAREQTGFPPFQQVIKCVTVSDSAKECQKNAEDLKQILTSHDSSSHQIFMAPALIPKINHKHIWNLFIQGPDPSTLLKKVPKDLLQKWRIDVDPIQSI